MANFASYDRLCPFLESSFIADVVFWPLIGTFLVVALEGETTTGKRLLGTLVERTTGRLNNKYFLAIFNEPLQQTFQSEGIGKLWAM